MTEEEKHEEEMHPDYEYTCTESPRKSGELYPPEGPWMPNPHKRFERGDSVEYDFWYRRKNPEPVFIWKETYYKVPSREWAHSLVFDNNDIEGDDIIVDETEVNLDQHKFIDLSHKSIDDWVNSCVLDWAKEKATAQ